MNLTQLIQSFFLGEGIVFLALFLMFGGLTYWALSVLKEQVGYLAGLMVGLLFILIYGSLVGFDPTITITAQTAPLGAVVLDIFQVGLSAFCGLILGVFAVIISRAGSGEQRLQNFLKVAGLTALGMILIFLMFVAGPALRRVIGIFAVSLAVTTLITLVIVQRVMESGNGSRRSANAQTSARRGDPRDPLDPRIPRDEIAIDMDEAPPSRLDVIRNSWNRRIRNRNIRDQR